jgi:hypothetical protein
MAADVFTVASLEGTFALNVTGHGGQASFAALGVLRFDGRGNVLGSLVENRPADRYGERTIVNVDYRATFTVDARGIGTIALVPSGEEDCTVAIRETDTTNGTRVVQELSLVFRHLDVSTGSLKTAVGTRLPEDVEFNNASLKGRYIGASIGRGGQVLAAGFGVLDYDGMGGFSESNMANVQGDSFRDRQWVAGSDRGPYAVRANGMGVVDEGGVVFVITRAKLNDKVAVAEEYAFFVRDLVPQTGVLFTGSTKKLSD